MMAIAKAGGAVILGAAGYKAWQTKQHQQLQSDWLTKAGQEAGPIDLSILTSKNPDKKICVVIGAGVAGICTAHEMASQGYSVVVLDKKKEISSECSRAPAGGMQKMNPGVSPGMWIEAAMSLLPSFSAKDESYEAFKFFRVQWWQACSDPHFIRWFALFTHASFFASVAETNYAQKHMLAFTVWSVDYFKDFLKNSHNGALWKKSGLVHTGELSLPCSLRFRITLSRLRLLLLSSNFSLHVCIFQVR
jgi:monoamine oxidase